MAQSTVRTTLFVDHPILLGHRHCFPQSPKEMLIQTFVLEATVETSDHRVVCWLAWAPTCTIHLMLLTSFLTGIRDKLTPIIASHAQGCLATGPLQALQTLHDL